MALNNMQLQAVKVSQAFVCSQANKTVLDGADKAALLAITHIPTSFGEISCHGSRYLLNLLHFLEMSL